MKTKKCYIYTRVSTEIQVEGYSLAAQEEKLKKYAEFQEMLIVGEYSDRGKSGKNVEDRPNFVRMLEDIENGKDNVDFVLVFKLSRFGRNAADVLSSLQKMQDFGVNLICTEDSIDSSKDSGKLMISVLSAVAEIERENILVQTMEGRSQKAKEGKWNGGFAPYGYKLVEGELKIAEDEREVIEVIYKKYATTTMGIGAVASYLNTNGYVKKKRQNNSLDMFSYSFVKGVLDNPIYQGKISYGRRKNEQIKGERNKFHIVKQKEFPIYKGKHEAIISEELWDEVKDKRKKRENKYVKKHDLEHANILSGILKCPICSSGLYGNVNRKKREDGTYYKSYFYYACKHRLEVDGHKCDYRKQWKQEKIDNAVAEVIMGLVKNPKFEKAIKEKINSKIDTKELDKELENLQKSLRQAVVSKDKLGIQIDLLDITDKFYDRKYEDMQGRLNRMYEDISNIEFKIEEINIRIANVKKEKFTSDSIYSILLAFDKLYGQFTDMEKKEFISSFVERVEIFKEEQPNGRLLKSLKFKFPVFFNEQEVEGMSWDKESTVESIILMTYCGFEGKK